MSNNQRPIVGKIVERFKSQLDENVRQQITSAQFAELALMIEEAVSEEVGAAADAVDEVVKRLRASTRKAEIGL